MAAGVLSEPGTEYGPCAEECKHTDCKTTREMADSLCPFCEKRIGYDLRFYRLDVDGLAHAVCAELDAERDNRGQ